MARKRLNNLHRCDKKGKHLEKTDGISELPDELLISILSCLTLKEAAKTCVLSHRWEKLWTFTTGVLDFGDIDSLKYLDKVVDELDSEELNYQRSKFTDWVNQIIKLHQGHSIDEFRLLFYLDSSSSCEINKWIEFALSKGVKRLKLDMASLALRKDVEKWTFPAVDKLIYARQNTKPCVTSSFQYQLTDITLRDVNIAQEAIEYLLLNSPFLEQLSVFGSSRLVNLRVSGPVLKLKALQISTCSNIKRVKISVASLISFSYFGPKIIMLIQNVPRLSELSVGGDYCWLFIEKIWQHEAQPGLLTPVKFPEFRNLTQLGVSLHSPYYKCIIWITSFIGSCPLLHTLTLWLNHCGHSQVQFCDMSPSFKERVQNARKCRHECLKVVELMDFRWLRTDVALATWLLETAVSLEKLIVEPEFGHCMPPEETQAHTENVMKLKEKLPSGARLVIGK